jgi:hypothetical protein
MEALETILEDVKNSCDEDDDNDYNDDDCDNCSAVGTDNILTSCTTWMVDKLERNNTDLDNLYSTFEFTFNPDGSIDVVDGVNLYTGTWSVLGGGNSVVVDINVIGFDDFNLPWLLVEQQSGTDNVKIDMRLGNDRLRIESTCDVSIESTTTEGLEDILLDGKWLITEAVIEDNDITSNYTAYTVEFKNDNTLRARDDDHEVNGNWNLIPSIETLKLNFPNESIFDPIGLNWSVINSSNTQIIFEKTNGSSGIVSTLTLTKE